tara:strand:- start:66 stop:272 length:207 start_codon:yes stop_codon:yes gene_type:complete
MAAKAGPSSIIKGDIEFLSTQRRDAAVMWGIIKNGNYSSAEIKKICRDKGFDTLLDELKQKYGNNSVL